MTPQKDDDTYEEPLKREINNEASYAENSAPVETGGGKRTPITQGSQTPSGGASATSYCSRTLPSIGKKRGTTEVMKFKFECLGQYNLDEKQSDGLMDCANIYRQKGIPCSHIITAYRYIYLKSI